MKIARKSDKQLFLKLSNIETQLIIGGNKFFVKLIVQPSQFKNILNCEFEL